MFGFSSCGTFSSPKKEVYCKVTKTLTNSLNKKVKISINSTN